MKPCDENLFNVVRMTEDMLSLADRGDLDREDTGCGVLYGVLRDAAFKIRQLAEVEIRRHIQKQGSIHMGRADRAPAHVQSK